MMKNNLVDDLISYKHNFELPPRERLFECLGKRLEQTAEELENELFERTGEIIQPGEYILGFHYTLFRILSRRAHLWSVLEFE